MSSYLSNAAFYRLVAGGPDPDAESFRWKRAGYAARHWLRGLMYLVARGRR